MGVREEMSGVREKERDWAQQLGPKAKQMRNRREKERKKQKGGRWDSNPGPQPCKQTRPTTKPVLSFVYWIASNKT